MLQLAINTNVTCELSRSMNATRCMRTILENNRYFVAAYTHMKQNPCGMYEYAERISTNGMLHTDACAQSKETTDRILWQGIRMTLVCTRQTKESELTSGHNLHDAKRGIRNIRY